jgi:nitrate reductase NapE component
MTDPATASKPPKKFPWWIYWITLVVILIVALWPVASVYLAYLVADANHCRVDEGSVHPCVINGQDWGEALYTLGVMGWFMLATIPLGVFGFLAWMTTLIVHRASWRKSRRAGR